jgi:flagellar M-ring protein FliF
VNGLLEMFKQLGPTRIAIMGSVIVGLLMFFIFVSMRVSTPELKLLYNDLSTADSGAIAAKLQESAIPFEVSSDGTTVRVSEKDVGRARMLLANSGLPNGGSLGYELFDKQSSFGTTNFVQNINQVRALEGELGRTIGTIDAIRSARVHLVLPQRELFSRENRPASASVFLTQRPGAQLSKEQILSIQSLVASAVPNLKTSNVSVIDSEGNLLARGGEEEEGLMSMKAEEMRRAYETRATRSLEDIIGRVVGFGHVRATVTAEMNFDRINMAEELFDPNTQVVRSSQVSEENNTERMPDAQDVSVQNNLPGIAGDMMNNQQPMVENNRVEEVTNFEISKTIKNTVREVGEIKRLSVAVLVDGIYTTDADGKRNYVPRTQQELDQIATLVRSAIGYNETRGDTVEIINMQFADVYGDVADTAADKLFGFERADLLDAVEIITVAIMVILVILLVLQPMMGRLLQTDGPTVEEALENELLVSRAMNNPALVGPSGEPMDEAMLDEDAQDSMISMQKVDGKLKASSVKKVEDIVEQYPAETVSVIRSWMTQES